MAGAALALTLGIAAAATLAPSDRGGPATVLAHRGGPAPSFELPDVREDRPAVSLAALRGRPVVLNFWASWCVPCRKEMPAFQAVAADVGSRVAFVGVNHQDSRRLALESLGDTGVSYPSAYDPGGTLAAAYRLRGMPTTVFISPDGEVIGRKTGEMSREELAQALDSLFDATTRGGRTTR